MRSIPGRLLVAVVIALTMATTTVSSASAAPRAGAHSGDFLARHGYAYTTTKFIVTGYNNAGKVTSRKVYSSLSAAQRASSSGGGPCSKNPCKVDLRQEGHSTLGKLLWHFTTWVWFYYDLQGPGLKYVINVTKHAYIAKADDTYWAFSKILTTTAGYYQHVEGVAHSGYRFFKAAEFFGPNSLGVAFRRPYNKIWVNGVCDCGSWEKTDY